MFDNFFEFFDVKDIKNNILNAEELLEHYRGCTFRNGLLRLFRKEDIEKWNGIVTEPNPSMRKEIECFGFNWTGMVFAKEKSNKNELLMFDCGTGQLQGIGLDLDTFLSDNIFREEDAFLLTKDFDNWRQANNKESIEYSQCVGFKVPMFLSGENSVDNLELSDMEVYWSVCNQILTATFQ